MGLVPPKAPTIRSVPRVNASEDCSALEAQIREWQERHGFLSAKDVLPSEGATASYPSPPPLREIGPW